MSGKVTRKIIERCTKIEKDAAELYESFTALSGDRKIGKFWKEMSDEEKDHIFFWDSLAELAQRSTLPEILDDPSGTLAELIDITKKVDIFKERYEKDKTLENAILLAFRIEFYLLHPVFANFFHFMNPMVLGVDPAAVYAEHLRKFVDAIASFGRVNPEIELLGETLQRIWKRNIELARQNSTDFLTDIYNRRGFYAAIRHLSHLSQRNSHNVGIIIADVDDFKKINDRYGHDEGDRVLKDIAATMKSSIRGSDIVARFGGEEFIIFLSTVERDSIESLAENIRKNVESGFTGEVRATISIGVADSILSRDVDAGINDLIRRADNSLYRAKAEGKNRVVYDDERPIGH